MESSLFSYKGLVKVTLRTNHKNIESNYFNNGTEKLFDLYCLALAGEPISELIPNNFDICKEDADTGVCESILYTPVAALPNYVGSTYSGFNKPVTRIIGVIPTTYINAEKLGTDNNFKLLLKDKLGRTLAKVDIQLEITQAELLTSSDIVIEWNLMIDNAVEG